MATFNVALNRRESGELTKDLGAEDPQAGQVAAIIRAVKPDILLVNELDFVPGSAETNQSNASLFHDLYLANDQDDLLGGAAWPMHNLFSAPVNTGVPSNLDLNQNGNTSDPEDAWGYGRFPGQYGMAVYSRFAIDSAGIRTFQKLRWSEMPAALRPESAEGTYYDDKTWSKLRLSSKSHWDVPITTPFGRIHLLASHPTPPAFDGPEDRNGCRNHDEIRLWIDYLNNDGYLTDDQGKQVGLPDDAHFVIVGDLNSDPHDGGSRPQAITGLIGHPRIAAHRAPSSRGGPLAARKQGQANLEQTGPAANDTADFSDRSVGNLRVDYALPSKTLQVVSSGVFWPSPDEIAPAQREQVLKCLAASDHRLVWVDVKPN